MRAHCFQHVAFEGLGSIEPWLVTSGARITTTRFDEDARLPTLGDVNLLVVMGGPMSVNDDVRYPWLAAERRFIREAIESNIAVLGICLGAQLIAHAMDARVFPNSEREIGWFPIVGLDEANDGPTWAAAGTESMVFHWHGETFDLPAGATPLARSAGCEHQAFSFDSRVIGMQFHLETTPALVRGLISHGRDELTTSRFVQSESEILDAAPTVYARLHALMIDTLERLTGVASDVRTAP